MKKRQDENDALYWIIWAMLLLMILMAGAVRVFHLEEVFYSPCPFRKITGLYCPGCGGTRAWKALLGGHILTSLRLHPLVPCGVCFLMLYQGSNTLSRLTGGRVRAMRYRFGYLAAGIVIVLANWIIKNYFLIKKGIDLLQ